jgi:hypothetical protein
MRRSAAIADSPPQTDCKQAFVARDCSRWVMRRFMGSMFQHKPSFGLELTFHELLDCFGLTLASHDQSHKAGTVGEARDTTQSLQHCGTLFQNVS